MSDEAETGAEAELNDTGLHARKTRKAAAADLLVDFFSPPISPETDRDKSIGLVDLQAEIAKCRRINRTAKTGCRNRHCTSLARTSWHGAR